MKESVKPRVSIRWPLIACQFSLLAIREMPGVGQSADDALLLAFIFFGGAVVGANVCSAAFGRCTRGKVA
ncbi:hypothetical protein COLINT_02306 [Collinsella intestinalis DSM 13280]|uniref:Uncharacterized protein n=1 Tax=Collinsella intestinalis DSM 13280 TaxID=521003 RepID=C4F8D5_9ACTN|nr:hypothetical protein [Collinsella intestinalis]EEP44807.1 hypothetical protein COLINT_02306 [Collinsella intestinalis DSM 13280]